MPPQRPVSRLALFVSSVWLASVASIFAGGTVYVFLTSPLARVAVAIMAALVAFCGGTAVAITVIQTAAAQGAAARLHDLDDVEDRARILDLAGRDRKSTEK